MFHSILHNDMKQQMLFIKNTVCTEKILSDAIA